MRPALPSPPPRPCLSLPAAHTPPAKFPSTHSTLRQLLSTAAQGRDSGQRPLRPCARRSGHEQVFSCHNAISPGLSTSRTHHHGRARCKCMGGTREDPLGTPGTAWGHLWHCWSITEPPPLRHRLMELNDPSVQGCSQRAGAAARTCPVPRGSWPAAPTIINPVRPWQLWLSLIDRVGAEVLGRAGPAASPTLSAVPGKQAPGTAPCCQSGWHSSQGLAPALPWPWDGSVGDRRVEGTFLREKHHPALMTEERKKGTSRQCSLFPLVPHHRQN